MKSYKIVQLEDMLGHVYSGRADLETIDTLIEWLMERRSVIEKPSTQVPTEKNTVCDECGYLVIGNVCKNCGARRS